MQENDAIGTVGSSLYETLQEEAALCCPVCGFQVLTASGNSSTNNANTSTNASAVAIANTPTHMPIGTCFLCLQAAAEAQAQTETMIDPTSHIHTVHDKEDIAIANNNQSGYDMIDYHQHQHQHWMAREKQEEEDRQLAASLTAMILEEERVRREVFQHQDLSDRYLADTQATRDGGFAMDDIHRAINHHRSPHFHDSPLQGATNTEIAGGGGENGGSRSQYSEEVDLIPREWLIEDQEARNHNLNSSVLEENAICSDVKTVPTATHVVSIHHQGDASHATLSTKDYDHDHDHDHDAYKHRATYIGDYNLLGQPHGSHGEVVWDNGNRYVGAFQNGMRSGQGTFFSRDGSEYTGGWKDNQMHGHGQRKFANGDTYIGQYRAGQRNGGPHWKLRFANGDLYVGGWENDRFHGDGRYFFAHDGSVLEGSFVCGAKQGKFKLQRQVPTEKLDILRFEDDELVGLGVRWNAKRTKTWLLQILPADPGPAGNGSSSNTSSNEPRAAAATVGSQNGSSSKTSSTATKVKKKKFHRRVIGCLSKPLRRRTKSSIETDVSMATLSMATPTATPLVPLVGITTVSVSNPDGSNGNSTQTTTSGPVSSSISPTPTPMPPSSSSSSSSSSLPPSFFLLPTDNLVPVAPQRILTNIKKSARIPISQAVSIGYDCEMGTATVTGKRTTASTVVATVSSQVTPSGQENVQRVVS